MTKRLPEPDDVRVARSVMERHYGEPVRPVSHYCERLASYADAIDIAIQEHDPKWGSSCGPFPSVEAAEAVRDGLRHLDMWRYKSNALSRLIYGDEPLREQRCPEHDGKWSGCAWDGVPCGCGSGFNVTGWLAPTPDDAKRFTGGPFPVVVRAESDPPGEPRP